MQLSRDLIPVTIFTLGYLLIATFFAFTTGNVEFLFYIAVVIVLALVALLVHSKVTLTSGVLWCLSIWGLLHMIGGLLPVPFGLPFDGDKGVFYSLWFIPGYLKYDNVVHAYGFAVATWVCWQALSHSMKVQPTFGIVTLCVLAGMGLGAVNEIVEFVAVLLIPDTNVGGYINTGWDMVANGVGAVLAGVFIRIKY